MSKRTITPQMKQALGHLVKTGREHLHLDRPPLLEAIEKESMGETPLSLSALKNIENGKSWPRGSNALRLERALRWRDGTIQELLDRGLAGEDLDLVTLKELADPERAGGVRPVTRASKLSNDELLAELTHRVKAMQAELEELEATGDSPAEVRAREAVFRDAARAAGREAAEQPIEEQAQVYLAAHAHGKAAKMRRVKPTKDEL